MYLKIIFSIALLIGLPTFAAESLQPNQIITVTTEKPTITPAKISACGKLIYPKEAFLARQQGIAEVQIDIDEQGTVTNTSIVKSSGVELLDQTALNYFLKCSFIPMSINGKNTSTTIQKKLSWSIKKEES